MGTFSIWHWVVVAVVVLLLFGGRGKLSSLMGDAAKGITAFKKGLKDGGEEAAKKEPQEPPKPIEADTATATIETSQKDKAANS